jgi:phage baseplate assembly protein W
MDRHDYAFPFRIDPASGQAARTTYPVHVEQLIRQVLLTSPGERVDLPEFGCGIRQLLFAPHSDALDATTQMLVQRSLDRWLGGQIEGQKTTVLSVEETGDEAQLWLRIEYRLVETQTDHTLDVQVR